MDHIHKRVQVFFALLQHDHHRGRGFRVPSRVRGASEKGKERGVVEFNASMGV